MDVDAKFTPASPSGSWQMPMLEFSKAGTMHINSDVGFSLPFRPSICAMRAWLYGLCTNTGRNQNIKAIAQGMGRIKSIKAIAQGMCGIKAGDDKWYLFNTAVAVARETVHSFFYTIAPPSLSTTVGEEDIANIWERATFGGLLIDPLDLPMNGGQWAPHARGCQRLSMIKNRRLQEIKLPAIVWRGTAIPWSKISRCHLPPLRPA